MSEAPEQRTIVFDAGARYGVHPSWERYPGHLDYYAFEPDGTEASRLEERHSSEWFHTIDKGLWSSPGTRSLNILSHRGLSTFLDPDLRNSWFERFRPGQSDVVAEVPVEMQTVDRFCREKDLVVDFLKIDTEGTELHVLRGAKDQLEENIIGIRSSASFLRYYQNQPIFSDIHDFLIDQGFYLLNLDYEGYGTPRNFLFRKPNPRTGEQHRYGMLMSTDGVWIRPIDDILRVKKRTTESALKILKYAAFCITNHAPDIGVDALYRFVEERTGFGNVLETALYRGVKRCYTRFLGRWRTYPDGEWEKVKEIYSRIFDEELQGGSEFWPQLQALDDADVW